MRNSILAALLICVPTAALANEKGTLSILGGVSMHSADYWDGSDPKGNSAPFGVRGEYYVTRGFSVEAGYIDFNQYTDKGRDVVGSRVSTSVNHDGTFLGINYTKWVDETKKIVFRIGQSNISYEYTERNSAYPNEVFKQSGSDKQRYLGAGMAYKYKDNINLGFELLKSKIKFSTPVNRMTNDMTSLLFSASYVIQ